MILENSHSPGAPSCKPSLSPHDHETMNGEIRGRKMTPDEEEALWGPIPTEQQLHDLLIKFARTNYPVNYDELIVHITNLCLGIKEGNHAVARNARRFRNHVERVLCHWENRQRLPLES